MSLCPMLFFFWFLCNILHVAWQRSPDSRTLLCLFYFLAVDVSSYYCFFSFAYFHDLCLFGLYCHTTRRYIIHCTTFRVRDNIAWSSSNPTAPTFITLSFVYLGAVERRSPGAFLSVFLAIHHLTTLTCSIFRTSGSSPLGIRICIRRGLVRPLHSLFKNRGPREGGVADSWTTEVFWDAYCPIFSSRRGRKWDSRLQIGRCAWIWIVSTRLCRTVNLNRLIWVTRVTCSDWV